MYIWALLFTIVTFGNALHLPEGRIVGGLEADIEEAPWQIALLRDTSDSGFYIQTCGGVIITETSVVTSAQCTYKIYTSALRVRAGSSYHNSGGQVKRVLGIMEHQDYNYKTNDNDIAFLYLFTPIDFGTTAMQAILPNQGLVVPQGSSCFFTGWGSLSVGGTIPTKLRKVSIPALSQEQCKQAYSGYFYSDNMLCAGFLDTGGADACQGDTGGPLTVQNILVGLSSWGIDCGQAKYPGVYTKVAMYRLWIDANMYEK